MALLSPRFMELYQNSPASKISNASFLTEVIFSSPKYRHRPTRNILDDSNRSIILTTPPPPQHRSIENTSCSPSASLNVNTCKPFRSTAGSTSSDERVGDVKRNKNKGQTAKAVRSVTATTCDKDSLVVGVHSRERPPDNSQTLVQTAAIIELPPPSLSAASVCDSTNNERYSESDDDFDGESFMMKSWFVMPTGKSSVFIEGETRVKTGYEPKNSSSIVKRINARTLLSKTGNLYKLVGKIDAKRAMSSGLPESFVSCFRNGFPKDWKSIVENHRSACKGTNINKSQASFRRDDAELKASTGRVNSSVDLSTLPRTRYGRIVFPPLEFWRRQRLVSRCDKAPAIASPAVTLRARQRPTSEQLAEVRNSNFAENISKVKPTSSKENIIQKTAPTTISVDQQRQRSKNLVVELQRIKPFSVIEEISEDAQQPQETFMQQRKFNREIGTNAVACETSTSVEKRLLKSVSNIACQASMSEEKRLPRSASNIACQTEFSRMCVSNIACQTDIRGGSPVRKKTWANVACQTDPPTAAEVERMQDRLVKCALAKVREISAMPEEFKCPPIVESNLAVGSPLKKMSERKSRKRRKSPSPSIPIESVTVEANARGLRSKASSQQRNPAVVVSENVMKKNVKQNKQPKIQTESKASKRERSTTAENNAVSSSINGSRKKVTSTTTKKDDGKVVIAGRDTLRFRRQFRDFVNVNCRDDDSDNDDIFATTPYRNACKLTGLANLRLNPDDSHEWGSKEVQLTPQVVTNRKDHNRNSFHLVPVSAKKTPNLHSGVSPFMMSDDDPAKSKREIDRYVWNCKKKKRMADRCKPSVRAESPRSLKKMPLLRRAPHLTEIDFGSNGSEAFEDEEDQDYYFSDND